MARYLRGTGGSNRGVTRVVTWGGTGDGIEGDPRCGIRLVFGVVLCVVQGRVLQII